MKVYSLKNGWFRLFTLNLSINDFNAAEGRYHVSSRSNFGNSIPKYAQRGQLHVSAKLTVFKIVGNKMEDYFKLYLMKSIKPWRKLTMMISLRK